MTEMINNTLPPQDGRRYVHNGTEWVLAESEQDRTKKKWYNLKQAMAYTSCKEHTIRNAIRGGYLIASKVPSGSRNGYAIYICEDDLTDWMKEPKKIRDQKAHDAYNTYMHQFSHKPTAQKEEKASEDILHIDGKNLYTVSEAAKTWDIGVNKLRQAIRSGFLKQTIIPHKSDKKTYVYIDEDDLLDWMDDRTKVRDKEAHEKHLAYKKAYNAKNYPKKTENDIPDTEPAKESSFAEPAVDMDISQIAACLMNLIKEKAKEAYKEGYKLGLEDGKLSVQHDKEESYRRGVEEGKKKAKEELMTLIKEVG